MNNNRLDDAYRIGVATGVLAIGLFSQSAVAAPSVNGNVISWPADGWYQVQRPKADGGNGVNWDVCNTNRDETSCEVPDGVYRVQLQGGSPWGTLQVWDGITVGESPPDDNKEFEEIWRDDFNGNTLSSNFFIPSWEVGDRRDVVISKGGVCEQSNGVLKLSIKQVGNERRACYLITQKSILFGPGENSTLKIEYRANFSQVKAKGAWFAGWLYANGFSGGNATDSNPDNGMEIDVFEYFPLWDVAYNTAIHDGINYGKWIEPQEDGIDIRSNEFRTYGLQWNKNCLAFYLDDKLVRTENRYVSSTKNHSLYLTMEAQTGYQWNSPEEFPVGSFAENLANSPAVGQIDWVKVSEKESIDPGLCD